MSQHTYDYAIVRVVPRVERGEFVNVGVILCCSPAGFLRARIEFDEARVRALDPDAPLDALRAALQSFERICAGGPGAGPIGRLPARARFDWLVAPRSSSVQTSPVHTGRCGDPEEVIERLMATMVRAGS